MTMQAEFNQDAEPAGSPSVEIAVLRERVATMGRELRELKESQRRELDDLRRGQQALAEKLDAVLTAMSEARGGWRTLMLVGGMTTTIGAAVTWLLTHLTGRGGV